MKQIAHPIGQILCPQPPHSFNLRINYYNYSVWLNLGYLYCQKKKKKSAIKKKSPLNVNVKNIVVVILSFSFLKFFYIIYFNLDFHLVLCYYSH